MIADKHTIPNKSTTNVTREDEHSSPRRSCSHLKTMVDECTRQMTAEIFPTLQEEEVDKTRHRLNVLAEVALCPEQTHERVVEPKVFAMLTEILTILRQGVPDGSHTPPVVESTKRADTDKKKEMTRAPIQPVIKSRNITKPTHKWNNKKCIHNKRLSMCRSCEGGGSNYCKHGSQKSRCVTCGKRCEHGKRPDYCRICNPDAYRCCHDTYKYSCQNCRCIAHKLMRITAKKKTKKTKEIESCEECNRADNKLWE